MSGGIAAGDPAPCPGDAGPSETPPLRVEVEGGVARLTLDRPGQFNALSEALLSALAAALARLSADDGLRCVILAGAGPAFCAGHDVKEMRLHDEEAWFRDLFTRCSDVMRALRALPVPVIAEVQGIATAAGCQLVAACDLAVAARSARFAVSGIDLGLFCSTPAVPLSRAIGPKAAFDMLFTGRFVSAEEACRLGLVNRVVEDADLGTATRAYAGHIVGKSPAAVRLGKAMFYRQAAMDLDAAYAFAGETMARNMAFPETRAAFEDFGSGRQKRS